MAGQGFMADLGRQALKDMRSLGFMPVDDSLSLNLKLLPLDWMDEARLSRKIADNTG